VDYPKGYNQSSIFRKQKNIVLQIIEEPSEDLLRELFKDRVKEHKYWLVGMECCCTVGLFDDLVQMISVDSAYSLVNPAVSICLEQTDKDLSITACSLIMAMVEKSNTTQLPKNLLEKWQLLSEKMLMLDDSNANLLWRGIKQWYRR
jgi:hypothetical protein